MIAEPVLLPPTTFLASNWGLTARESNSALFGVILRERLEDDPQVTLAMLRDDWWWPWWVSTLIDLAVVAIAVTAFVASRRRAIRLVAATFVLVGLVAAIMAPIVMSNDSNGRMDRMEPDNSPMMSP